MIHTQIQHKISVGGDANIVRSIELESNLLRGSSGKQGKVVFQSLLIAVIAQINAGVQIANQNVRERGNGHSPLGRIVGNEVINLPAHLLIALHTWVRIGTDKLQMKRAGGNRRRAIIGSGSGRPAPDGAASS